MSLVLKKTQEELEQIFRVKCTSSSWQKEDGQYCTGDFYPLITNERPVQLQSIQWGFPLYLDDNRTLLKLISQVGVESVLDKSMFECITSKRCLVPLQIGGDIVYGAGVWDVFIDKSGVNTKRFVILTNNTGDTKKRTPFMLENGSHRFWLKPNHFPEEEVMSMLGIIKK